MSIPHLLRERDQRGFTLVEMMVAVLILAVVAGAAFLVLNSSATAKRTGDHVAEAQQNARAALNAIVADLRQTGYGILTGGGIPPIEVASDYRMTFIIDRDRDGVVEPGERVTYFVDPDQNQMLTSSTENPFDYVIRRVESTVADPAATPAAGAGRVVAYMITQRSSTGAAGPDVPVFTYFDANNNVFTGVGTDPAGTDYGTTLPDSLLGLPAGSGLELLVDRIDVNLITETPVVEGNDKQYRRFAISAQVHPRNFTFELVSNFEIILNDGTGDPTDSTGTTDPTDTTGTDTTTVPVLPPYEPPIRISTARVLSLDSADLGEWDSKEGSDTSTDYQGDFDIVLGTKAGTNNNLSVWLNGQPGLYGGRTYYNSVPNYYGKSPYDLQDIRVVNLDMSPSEYPDAVAAVKETDVRGGFQVWINQEATNPGYVGDGAAPTQPTRYDSENSGQGRAIGIGDFDRDGDRDVILGTAINTNQGTAEFWENDGTGQFRLVARYTTSGEVNSICVLDMDRDGWLEFACGTKTTTSGNNGTIDVFKNTGGLFYRFASYDAGGQVKALEASNINADSHTDLIAGLRTSNNQGKVQFWKGSGGGFILTDQAMTDAEVLSLAVGNINLEDSNPDIVVGTNKGSIQAWFTDPGGADNAIPDIESWSDANAGGQVQAVEIVKIEKGRYTFFEDPLYDIIAGTAVSATEGEIVLYLNPYVWTLQQ